MINCKHSSTKERTVIVKQTTERVIKYNTNSDDEKYEKWTTQAGYYNDTILSTGLMHCLLRNFLSAENDEIVRWAVDTRGNDTSRNGS